MGDSLLSKELLNPCVLHLQKLLMELKCPICLNLLSQPVSLSCDHIFCSSCYLRSVRVGCPVCKSSCSGQELWPVPHMERLVIIYRGVKAAFDAALLPTDPQVLSPEVIERPDETHKAEGTFHDVLGNKTMNSNQETSFTKSNHGLTVKESSGANIGSDFHCFSSASMAPSSTSTCEGIGIDQYKVAIGISDGDSTGIVSEREPTTAHMKSESFKVHAQNHVGRSPVKGLALANVTGDVLCAFCQSSRETEGSGPLMHYVKGRPVYAWEKSKSKVVHVHIKCAEWSPQIYFDKENIRNLDSEISRSAKLRCNKCGQKGASLGCLAKSCRRTFHVPCAVDVQGCRWDCENFFMYCPAHASLKFPGEETKPEKRRRVSCESPKSLHPISNQDRNNWMTPCDKSKKWVLCGSALTASEKEYVAEFASLTGANVCKAWDHNVTHVIASLDENGCCKRTLKVLMAILAGSWVVNINWIKACLEAASPVGEEPYEIDRDIHGFFEGPKIGRHRLMSKESPLFSGMLFYFFGDYDIKYQGYLEELVLAAGASIVADDFSSFASKNRSRVEASAVIVYNQGCSGGLEVAEAESIRMQRMKEAMSLAAETNAKVIGHTWILDSVASCRILPLLG